MNLQRNSEIFLSTINLANGSSAVGMTPSNTWKVDVLAGFAATNPAQISSIYRNSISATQNREAILYKKTNEPVSWNFTNYIRPTTSNTRPVADWFMWQNMSGTWSESVLPLNANTSSLPTSYMYLKLDNVFYQASNVVVDSCSLDAGIQEIATTTWSGTGTEMVELRDSNRDNAVSVFGGILSNGFPASANSSIILNSTGFYHPFSTMNINGATSNHSYVKNRLSSLRLVHNSNLFSFPITALSFSYENGTSYLNRNALGSISKPIQNYTGSQKISASFSAYLRENTANLLREIQENGQLTSNSTVTIKVGDLSILLSSVEFSFPQIGVEDILLISAEIQAKSARVRLPYSYINADRTTITVDTILLSTDEGHN